MTRVVVAVLALLGLAIDSAPASAAICGFTDTLLKSSFEAGELPGVTLPPSSTPLTLTVTSPADNATVSTATMQVVGTWTGPANTGITVNGHIVLADLTSFGSLPVLLQQGSNTITVVATTQDGASQTVTRSVTYDPLQAQDVNIASNTTGDFAPLNASFNVQLKSGLGMSVVRIQADFDGNGSVDLDTTNSATALNFAYLNPGTYDASFTVNLDDNDPMTPPVVRTASHRVVVLNPNVVRQTLCQVYTDMRSRLEQPSPDINGALNTLHPEFRSQFQTFWTSLGSGVGAAALNLGEVADGRFSVSTGDLLVARPVAGQPSEFDGFRVLFEKDVAGVWRITGM